MKSSVPPTRTDVVEDASGDDEARRFLQQRLATFAAFITLLHASLLTLRAAATAMGGFGADLPPIVLGFQAGAVLCLGGIWLYARAGRRSVDGLHAAEAVGIIGAGLCLAILGYLLGTQLVPESAHAELASSPDTSIALVLARTAPLALAGVSQSYVLILRAAFVPSSPLRTTILTATTGVPSIVTGILSGQDTAHLAIPWLTPAALAVAGAVQWGVTTVICAVISLVIYGLRQEVQQAKRLGQYTLEELIGEGGMGLVYRASHAMLRRKTAVKLLPPEKAGRTSLERFEREVQLTAQLTHPNTVTIYDYGRTADGTLYYAMELLNGATLEEIVLHDGPQSPGRVWRILDQVAGALGEAHAIGLVHRDVKPSNIVLCRQGGALDVAKVVDFGLVKDLQQAPSAAVSQEGMLAGTPLYMAPEMVTEPGQPDARSDLYALGAVGYYLLTGEHVFAGGSVIEVLGHHMHSDPERPSERLGAPLPEDLEDLVLDLLAKDPSRRPGNALEVRRRLERCAAANEWSPRLAEAWWQKHGVTLRQRGATLAEMTLEVDVSARGATAS